MLDGLGHSPSLSGFGIFMLRLIRAIQPTGALSLRAHQSSQVHWGTNLGLLEPHSLLGHHISAHQSYILASRLARVLVAQQGTNS